MPIAAPSVPGLSDAETFRTNNSVRQIAEALPKLATLDGASMSNVSIDGLTVTGAATAETKDPLDNSTAIATTAYADAGDAVVTAALGAHAALTNNPHAVTKAQVGLGNVSNVVSADLPISTATQSALDLKAPLASPALTGTPTAPTAAIGTVSTQVATTAFVRGELYWTRVVKSTDQSVTTAVTDNALTFPVEANAKYLFRGIYWIDTSGGTSGAAVSINGPASPTRVRAYGTAYASAYGSNLILSGSSFTIGMKFDGVIENGSTAGNITFTIAHGAAGATIFERGSWLEWSKIS